MAALLRDRAVRVPACVAAAVLVLAVVADRARLRLVGELARVRARIHRRRGVRAARTRCSRRRRRDVPERVDGLDRRGRVLDPELGFGIWKS